MNVVNARCFYCWNPVLPNQAFCTNCGKPYTEPVGQDRGRVPAEAPPPKRRSKSGIFIGISGLVVMLLLVGTGVFLFAKSKSDIAHSDVLYYVAWSPDGSYIVSGSSDKTVQVWQPK